MTGSCAPAVDSEAAAGVRALGPRAAETGLARAGDTLRTMIRTTICCALLALLAHTGLGAGSPPAPAPLLARASHSPLPHAQPEKQPEDPQGPQNNAQAEDEDPLGVLAAAKSPESNRYTRASFYKERAAVEKRLLKAQYEQSASRVPAQDTRVLALLDLYADWDCEQAGNTPEPRLAAMGAALLDEGCEDPLVRAIHALAVDGDAHPRSAAALMQEAIAGLSGSGYSPHPVVYLVRRLATHHAGTLDDAGKLALRRQAADALIASICRPLPDETILRNRCYLAEHEILENLPEELAVSVADRVEQCAESDPWIKLMLRAYAHQRKGWNGRGRGFTAGVTAEGAKTFRDELTHAKEQFAKAFALSPRRPEPASCMIEVAHQLGDPDGDDMITWFRRAVTAEFDFRPSYQRLSFMCSPRWGGSYEQVLAVGQWCAQTQRYDTRIPTQFVDAVLSICDEIHSYSKPWADEEMYSTAKQVLAGTADHPANAGLADSDRSLLASIAYRAGRFDDSREASSKLTPATFDGAMARRVRVFPEEVLGESRVRAGPAATQFQAGLESAQAGKWSDAAAMFAKATGLCAADSVERWAARGRELAAIVHAASDAHEMATVPFEPGLPGWIRRAGAWEVRTDGSVRATSDGLNLMLLLREPVGREWDMEVAFRVVETEARGEPQNVAVVLGWECESGASDRWQSCMVYTQDKAAALRVGFVSGREAMPADIKEGFNTLRVELHGEMVKVLVNGVACIESRSPLAQDRWKPGPYVGLGAGRPGVRHVLEFKNFKIRIGTK